MAQCYFRTIIAPSVLSVLLWQLWKLKEVIVRYMLTEHGDKASNMCDEVRLIANGQSTIQSPFMT
jgi:hypothetical protein